MWVGFWWGSGSGRWGTVVCVSMRIKMVIGGQEVVSLAQSCAGELMVFA